MADFVSLTCPSCNGKLQIGKDLERFACGYCGTEFVVNRGGGIVSLSPVVEGLKRVERGVDKTASELAIARLSKDIDGLERQWASVASEDNMALYLWGIGLLIISPVASNGNTTGLLVVGGLGALLLFIAVSSTLGNSKKKKEIEAQLGSKRSEMARHQQIVKS
jgi:hypothetical protein